MACTDESHAPLVAVIETALPGRRVVGPLRPVDNGFCNDVYFAELEPDEHIVLRVTRTTDGLQKWRTYKTRVSLWLYQLTRAACVSVRFLLECSSFLHSLTGLVASQVHLM